MQETDLLSIDDILMHPKRLIDLIEIVDRNRRLENVRLRQLRDPAFETADGSTDEFFDGEMS